jgi:hypothetical protein
MPETLPSECTRQYLTISAVLLRPAGFRPGRKGTDADSRERGGGQARCHTASKGSNEIAVDLLGNVILSIITPLLPAINQSNIRGCSFYLKENNTSWRN